MTERPILFSAPMVRALLDGTKTQTRRVCKKAESAALAHVVDCGNGIFGDEAGDVRFRSPYGRPGDRLWVRETWAFERNAIGSAREEDGPFVYRATDSEQYRLCDRWRPSIHMPRAASRILLEVTGVRVERLQDISERDAVAEGIEKTKNGFWSLYGQHDVDGTFSPRASYRALWESINGAGSWDANQWVWVVELKRVMP